MRIFQIADVPRSPNQEQQIVDKYLGGMKTLDIAQELGISPKEIYPILDRSGVALGPSVSKDPKSSRSIFTKEDEWNILKAYQEEVYYESRNFAPSIRRREIRNDEEHLSRYSWVIDNIAAYYKVSPQVIKQVIEGYDSYRLLPDRKKGRLSERWERDIVSRYEKGEGSTSIALDYGVNPGIILGILRGHDVPIREKKTHRLTLDDRFRMEDEIAEEYVGGKSVKELAEEHGISRSMIYNILRSRGLSKGKRGKRPTPLAPKPTPESPTTTNWYNSSLPEGERGPSSWT
jgi:transposase-like protein